ncbi:isoinhibitor K-like [Lycorma delicatula]|uniref:isoinhibitor K-like n=1 Tax=Lycorma delicatula TaxID=130591 RepID=UPI003F51231A
MKLNAFILLLTTIYMFNEFNLIYGRASFCHYQAETGLCKAAIIRWYYNQNSDECFPFQYGGCGGNENNFLSKQLCEEVCHVSIHEI